MTWNTPGVGFGGEGQEKSGVEENNRQKGFRIELLAASGQQGASMAADQPNFEEALAEQIEEDPAERHLRHLQQQQFGGETEAEG
jgi:hypothetical protein